MLMPEKCAKRSLPPSSGVMNPKPFASLNHLTVPVAICQFPFSDPDMPSRKRVSEDQGRELTATSDAAWWRVGRGVLRLHYLMILQHNCTPKQRVRVYQRGL